MREYLSTYTGDYDFMYGKNIRTTVGRESGHASIEWTPMGDDGIVVVRVNVMGNADIRLRCEKTEAGYDAGYESGMQDRPGRTVRVSFGPIAAVRSIRALGPGWLFGRYDAYHDGSEWRGEVPRTPSKADEDMQPYHGWTDDELHAEAIRRLKNDLPDMVMEYPRASATYRQARGLPEYTLRVDKEWIASAKRPMRAQTAPVPSTR